MTKGTNMGDGAIRDLLDKHAIHEALLRYCRGVDRANADLIRSAYWDDVTENHGRYQGHRLDDFIDYVAERGTAFHSVAHHVSNHLIELAGDTAHSEAYVLAIHTGRRDGGLFQALFGGRYVDRFEKRHDSWRIADRVVVHDWSVQRDVEEWERGRFFVQGTQSVDDVVYHRGGFR